MSAPAVNPSPSLRPSSIAFPDDCLVGSVGDWARIVAEGSEVPPEFLFAAGLTFLGGIVTNKLSMVNRHEVEPRLFTVLLGKSGIVKKSSALAAAREFFSRIAARCGCYQPIPVEDIPHERGRYYTESDRKELENGKMHLKEFGIVDGSPGSGEGLVRCFKNYRSLVVSLDELKMLVDKAAITGSSLLSVVTSLFEKTTWEAPIKDASRSSGGGDMHLSVVGCCTTDTYEDLWTPAALDIGLVNRLFVVTADARPRVWRPKPIAPDVLQKLEDLIKDQIDGLPDELDFTREADVAAEAWYKSLSEQNHVVRLDGIAKRLMLLIALTMDKSIIDLEVVQVVTKIMDYEYAVRRLNDPIDADNKIAQMEEKVRRQLEQRGAMNKRSLQQYTNSKRIGGWAFRAAIDNLIKDNYIWFDPKTELFEAYAEPTVAAAEPPA